MVINQLPISCLSLGLSHGVFFGTFCYDLNQLCKVDEGSSLNITVANSSKQKNMAREGWQKEKRWGLVPQQTHGSKIFPRHEGLTTRHPSLSHCFLSLLALSPERGEGAESPSKFNTGIPGSCSVVSYCVTAGVSQGCSITWTESGLEARNKCTSKGICNLML